VTEGLAESNGRLPPCLLLISQNWSQGLKTKGKKVVARPRHLLEIIITLIYMYY